MPKNELRAEIERLISDWHEQLGSRHGGVSFGFVEIAENTWGSTLSLYPSANGWEDPATAKLLDALCALNVDTVRIPSGVIGQGGLRLLLPEEAREIFHRRINQTLFDDPVPECPSPKPKPQKQKDLFI